MLDILCIGDSKIDIFLQIPASNPHFGLDKTKNQLFVSLGEKIHVDKHIIGIGGNATNTGVGISRLGLKVGLCVEIGTDEFSQRIINKLKKENINTDLLIQTEKENTSLTVGINYKGERTLFTEHEQREHKFNLKLASTRFVYLTALGEIWSKPYEETLAYVKADNLKLAFNPGSVQLDKRGRVINDILERTDYLFVNKEEAEEILYGKEVSFEIGNIKAIKKLMYGLKSLGVKNVIITDSNNGSYVQDETGNIFFLDTFTVPIVEKTGAGDAYTAGFLSAILSNKSVKDAMVWGTINASSVIQKIGAEEGLLLKDNMDKELLRLKNFYPQTI